MPILMRYGGNVSIKGAMSGPGGIPVAAVRGQTDRAFAPGPRMPVIGNVSVVPDSHELDGVKLSHFGVSHRQENTSRRFAGKGLREDGEQLERVDCDGPRRRRPASRKTQRARVPS